MTEYSRFSLVVLMKIVVYEKAVVDFESAGIPENKWRHYISQSIFEISRYTTVFYTDKQYILRGLWYFG